MSEHLSTNAAAGQLPPALKSHDVTTFDSGLVFVVKALFYPVGAVAFLALCLWLGERPFNGTYFLIAVLSFAGVAEFLDDSRIDHGDVPSQELRSLLSMQMRWLGVGAGILLVCYVLHIQAYLFDSVVLVWFVFTPAVLWTGTIGVRWLLLQVGLQYMETRNAVIVGVTEQGLMLSDMLKQQSLLRVNLCGFFDDRDIERLPSRAPTLGSIAEAAAYIKQQGIHVVYITLPLSRHPRILSLLDALNDTVASVYFVPDLGALSNIQARLDVVHGIPMIAVCESPFFGVRSLAKRICDVIISLLILIAISPVLLGVAIGVKWSSPGPVIFKQRRYGLDGREIMVYKFRSMSVTEDGDQQFTAVNRHDPRVTRFGALIRKTSLDELPQFINVIEGTMSIVGPRPHAVAMNEQYRKLIPSYMLRHKVKPGITGWAQVNGYRGGDDLESMKKRIEFDIEYLRRWSLRLDLVILLRTVKLVVADARAY